MKTIFLIISTALPVISPIIYSKAILRGDAKPHRTTRFVLLLINTLAAASLIAQHNNVAVWLAGVSLLQSIIVFVLSFKYGMGGWTKTDVACLIIAIAGIILWQTTNNPVIALYFAIFADFTGMIPTIIKTYHKPNTEVWSFFLLDSVAGAFNLLALSAYAIKDFSYPLYIVIINLLMVLLITKPKTTSLKS
ncbi:MAG TPA: hypothetical protein VM077_04605 [Candidatus Limnocylindrales bacterium]|nr:hypothetical protein [Candidatus Limnocylindrales bacterium]